jgi:IstB-like ATP binding protein
MLVNPTISKLENLGLGAMAAGLADQLETPGPWSELCFEDRLGLLADREADARDTRRLANRLKAAKLRYPAAIEDIDFRTPRGRIVRSSSPWPAPAGSPGVTTCSSPAPPGVARALSPAP